MSRTQEIHVRFSINTISISKNFGFRKFRFQKTSITKKMVSVNANFQCSQYPGIEQWTGAYCIGYCRSKLYTFFAEFIHRVISVFMQRRAWTISRAWVVPVRNLRRGWDFYLPDPLGTPSNTPSSENTAWDWGMIDETRVLQHLEALWQEAWNNLYNSARHRARCLQTAEF